MRTHRTNFTNAALLMLVVLLDYMAMSVVYTTVLFLFLDHQSTLLGQSSESHRLLLLGFLFAMSSLGQFLSAPILGRISDSWGRKKGLVLTTAGSLLGVLLTAIAITISSLSLLFVSRILVGLFAGNLTIAQASFADMGSGNARTVRFNLLEIAMGGGFIIGPLLGIYLINPHLVTWFSYSTPFYCLAFLNLLLLILLRLFFVETRSQRGKISLTIAKVVLQTPQQLITLFKTPNLRGLLCIWMIAMFGFSLYTQFFTTFLKQAMELNHQQIRFLFNIMGLIYIMLQIAFVYPLVKRMAAARLIKLSLLLMAILITALSFSHQLSTLYALRLLAMAAIVVFMPSFNAVVANNAATKIHGQVFGVLSSLYALVSMIAAVIGAVLTSHTARLPVVVAGGLLLGAWLILFFAYQPQQREL